MDCNGPCLPHCYKKYIYLCLILFIILLIALYWIKRTVKEQFMMFNIPSRVICPTRNQSYDLRGDPISIDREILPINNSEFGPLYPKLCSRHGFDIV